MTQHCRVWLKLSGCNKQKALEGAVKHVSGCWVGFTLGYKWHLTNSKFLRTWHRACSCSTKGMHSNKIITTKSVELNSFKRKQFLPPSGQVCGDRRTLRRDKVRAVIIPFAQTWADRDLRFCFVKKPLRLWPASLLKCIGFGFAVIDGAWSPPTGCWEISSAHDAEMGGGARNQCD